MPLKDRIVNVDDFLDALRRVACGGSALDPVLVTRMVGRHRQDDPVKLLSVREGEVLALMAEGRTNRAIAEKLTISQRAAEKHVTGIFTKLKLDSTPDDHRRVLAVLQYLQPE